MKSYEDRDKETSGTGGTLVSLAVNVMADNTTVCYSGFLGMLSEILALLKTMAKIPLTSVMPRQMELPRVSQQPALASCNLTLLLQFHPSHCQNQTQRGKQGIAMHKWPICVFPTFRVRQQAKQAA